MPLPGADFLLNWDRKLRQDASVLRCCGTTCTTSSTPTFRFSYASGATFTILAADLGETRRLRFSVRVTSGIVYGPGGDLDFTDFHQDIAPAEGSSWTYDVLLRPRRLLVEGLSVAPAAPRAGGLLTVQMTVRRDDTGALVSSGRVLCSAAIAGKRVRPRVQRYLGRQAKCVFALPAEAGGKTIRGSITVLFQGVRASKTFARRVGSGGSSRVRAGRSPGASRESPTGRPVPRAVEVGDGPPDELLAGAVLVRARRCGETTDVRSGRHPEELLTPVGGSTESPDTGLRS